MSLQKDDAKITPRIPDLPPDFLAWQSVAVLVGAGETRSLVAEPRDVDDCREVMKFCRKTGLSLCPRGSGRSYGDAILNDQNVILDMSRMNRLIALDEVAGTLTVEPGARLADLYHEFHHLGWTLPASPADPATARAAVGKSVELLASQKKRAMIFYRASKFFINLGFNLQKIPIRLFNMFFFAMSSRNHPEQGDSAIDKSSKPEMFLEHNFDKSYVIPPPDILCGPQGYTVQITVPEKVAGEAMTEMLQLCQSIPCPPVTTILRLHRRDDHVISFSEDGYSLNVEFHPKKRHARKMAEFMEKFIECGIKYGSRVHLPKDNTLTRDQFQRLYPRYGEFLELKSLWDPENLFQSDMYRRLFAAE